MKHRQLLPLLFCVFFFACKKDLNTNATVAKPGNTAFKQGSYKSFSTDKQTQAAIKKFIQDSIHDFKTLDSYLSQFLTGKFKRVPTRQNATLRVEDDNDIVEPDEIYSFSWSDYAFNEPGEWISVIRDYSIGEEYDMSTFEGVAHGTATFQRRHNTVVINFPYVYWACADRRYRYNISSHNLLANLTGPALGELDYNAAYAYNVDNRDRGDHDGQIEGFVNIREKRTRIVDDELNVTFTAGAKAEFFEVGGEIGSGRTIHSVSNCIGDYTINIMLQLTEAPFAFDAGIIQWMWGNIYYYPKPQYNMIINGTNLDYQQN